ncbi:MAG: hypothetical protein NXI18_10265 [Alphaproteobacteria bacterium]|nr:hypothetical protein [Alphaproteobacteria bacterium]
MTIRTAQGDIRADLVRAQVAELLRAGTRVTLELRSPTAAPPQLVVTVRGGTAPQAAVSTGASGPPPTVPLTVGRILQAVTVPGPAPAGNTAIPAGAGQQSPPAAPTAAPTSAPTTGPTAAQGAPGGTPAAAAQGVSTPSPSGTSAAAPAQPLPSTTGGISGSGAGGAQGAGVPVPPVAAPAAQPAQPQSALAAQSAYRSALGLTGRAAQAPPLPAAQQAVPVPQTAAQPPSASGGVQSAGTATAGGGLAAAAPHAGGGPQLPVGAVVTVRVLATGGEAARFVGAQTTAHPAAGGQAGQPASTVLAGTVSGVTQSGRPVVATPFGHLAINATSDLRIGDRVALDVLASRVGDIPTAERPAPLSVLAREWPALEGAMRVLQETLGQQAAAQLTQAMVRPSPQMTAAMLFFMSALKGGDMRSWFGNEASRALESAGRGGLLSALAEDFQTLQRAAEPAENGWRAFLIPLVGDEKRPIRVLTRGRRGRRGDKDGNGDPDGTSFLVDLELSKLGPFRLDGLVRGDLVDLWIRTTKPLPALIRHDIKALFDGTLDRTGIQGRLAFKATPVLPPLPVSDLQAAAAGDTESLFA